MKKNIFGLLSALLCVAALSFQSCNTDPCQDKVCLNGATCNEGVCLCPNGYSGTNCEIEDPCINTVCSNGGTCADGSCLCVLGYEGESCDSVSTDKFIGTFDASLGNAVSEDCGSGPFTYPSQIQKHPQNFAELQIKDLGFYNTDEGTYWVNVALTSATRFDISTVFGTFGGEMNYYTMTGSGEYNADTRVLVVDYVCTYNDGSGGTATDQCQSTFNFL